MIIRMHYSMQHESAAFLGQASISIVFELQRIKLCVQVDVLVKHHVLVSGLSTQHLARSLLVFSIYLQSTDLLF